MPAELTFQDLADLFFWTALALGSIISFGLGFIGGQQR